jgi:hypothetical protein
MSEINYSVRERGEWLSFRRCVTQLDITLIIVRSVPQSIWLSQIVFCGTPQLQRGERI